MKPKKTQKNNTQRKNSKRMIFADRRFNTDRYINPFTDFGFKKLFGEECNKELLLSFLNELLQKKEGRIVSLSYLNRETLGFAKDTRKAVFDIFCENEKGEKFIVEMQKARQNFFKDRALFYSSSAIMQQGQADWNYELKAVYIIAILDFVFEESKDDPEKYRYDVMLTDIETNKIFYDKLTFIYLEMPKFNKGIDELKTRFDKWLYVIKNIGGLLDIPDKLQERIFKKMFAAAEIANLSKEDYWRYLDNFTAENDLNNVLDTAKGDGLSKGFARGLKKGLNKGLVAGRAKGRAEGKAEEREKIVINSYQEGLSEELIINISGLKIEDIRAILEKKLILTP